MLCCLIAVAISVSAAGISDLQLIAENSIPYLSFQLTPIEGQETILLTPETAQTLSNNLFSLSNNLTIELNLTTMSSLYEIDRSQNETLFSSGLSLWCGATYSSCNECNGLPPGTYKWCNSKYPQTSYYCDTWCYSFSPGAVYEKAQTGAFLKNSASATVRIEEANAIFKLDYLIPSQSVEAGSASLIFPGNQNQQPPLSLIRPYSSEKWKVARNSDLQSYKNQLASYYAGYTSGLGNAYNAHDGLNAALNAVIANSNGEYVSYYEIPAEPGNYPQILLKLRADLAGVAAVRGKPEILSFSPNAIIENGAGYYELELKNAGFADDTFEAFLLCDNQTGNSTASSELIHALQIKPLRFYFERMASPSFCLATAFIKDVPSISASASSVLEPFKLPCPAEMKCCYSIPEYEDRSCESKQLFKQEDGCGNGYYYLQNYACGGFTCNETTTELKNRISNLCPSPTPQNSGSSYSGHSQSYNANSYIPSPSPSPSKTPSPSPAPSIPEIIQRVELKEEKIDILAPEKLTEGYHQISVLSDSLPASGSISLYSPSYKKHSLELLTGSAEALFNEPGEWKISYKEEVKYVLVTPIQLVAEEKRQASEATAMVALNLTNLPFFESALVMMACGFLFAGFKTRNERIRFKKNFENNIVRLEIFNNKADLKNLEITDIVPEGNILSTISNPPSEVTEIIFGKHIKWKKNELRKGERLLISYSIFSNNKTDSLREAEMLADIEGNKKIRVLSNAILP
ncbi:MAG: hypothetical protein V1658_03765 [Candidatus Micrarchaeota archaeon]